MEEKKKLPEYIFEDAVDSVNKRTHIPKRIVASVLMAENYYLRDIGVMHFEDGELDKPKISLIEKLKRALK